MRLNSRKAWKLTTSPLLLPPKSRLSAVLMYVAAPAPTSILSAVCSVQCAVCSVQCAVCSVQCTVFNVQYAVYSVPCTVYSVGSIASCQCSWYTAAPTELSLAPLGHSSCLAPVQGHLRATSGISKLEIENPTATQQRGPSHLHSGVSRAEVHKGTGGRVPRTLSPHWEVLGALSCGTLWAVYSSIEICVQCEVCSEKYAQGCCEPGSSPCGKCAWYPGVLWHYPGAGGHTGQTGLYSGTQGSTGSWHGSRMRCDTNGLSAVIHIYCWLCWGSGATSEW